jgi:hypothetical protein
VELPESLEKRNMRVDSENPDGGAARTPINKENHHHRSGSALSDLSIGGDGQSDQVPMETVLETLQDICKAP